MPRGQKKKELADAEWKEPSSTKGEGERGKGKGKGKGRGRGKKKKQAAPKVKACIRRLKVPLTAAQQQPVIHMNLGSSLPIASGLSYNGVYGGATYTCTICRSPSSEMTHVTLPNMTMVLCPQCSN